MLEYVATSYYSIIVLNYKVHWLTVKIMKRSYGKRTVNMLKSVFNARKWLDYDRIKTTTVSLSDNFKTMFIPQEPGQSEELEQVMARLGLSRKDLVEKQKAFYRLSLLMIFLAFLVLVYAGYHIYYFNLLAIVMSLVVACVALGFAFRYHFWYFQIKKGKLGCSFKEWFREGFLGQKHEA